MNVKALFNLYPDAHYFDEGDGLIGKDGNPINIVQSDYESEVARLKEEYEAEQIQIESDKASAISKLEALGLTDAEIKALSGGL